MKIKHVFAISFICLMVSLTLGCRAKATKTDTVLETLFGHMDPGEPGVAITVRLNGETVESQGFGLANLEYGIPFTPTTSTQIASISKQFTAFAALLLVADNKIALDDDIQTYIPELELNSSSVKIHHLLDHTSGLRGEASLLPMAGHLSDDVGTNQRAFDLIRRQTELNFEPGSQHAYNNTNYFLLAKIVERVSGKPFAEFCKDKIFAPLDMRNSAFITDRKALVPGRAYSYQLSGNDFENARLNSSVQGSTGMYTTAEDLIKWAENFETPKVGSDQLFEMMSKRPMTENNVPATLARGQELRHYNGMDVWVHGGRTGGYRTFLIRIPSQKFAVSVLANRADFDMAKSAFDIVDAYFPKGDAPDWQPADKYQVLKYAGDYEVLKGVIFSLYEQDGKLHFATNGSRDGFELPQAGPHLFSLNSNQNTMIEFKSGPDGRTDSLDYVISQNGRIPANRITLESFEQSDLNLEDYIGDFTSPELDMNYAVDTKGDQLFLSSPQTGSIAIYPYQSDVFSSNSSHFSQVRFTRNTLGEVNGIKLSFATANDIDFKKFD